MWECIVLSKQAHCRLESMQPISARNIVLTLSMQAGPLDIVSTYAAPQACHADPHSSDRHYEELCTILQGRYAYSDTPPKLYIWWLQCSSYQSFARRNIHCRSFCFWSQHTKSISRVMLNLTTGLTWSSSALNKVLSRMHSLTKMTNSW